VQPVVRDEQWLGRGVRACSKSPAAKPRRLDFGGACIDLWSEPISVESTALLSGLKNDCFSAVDSDNSPVTTTVAVADRIAAVNTLAGDINATVNPTFLVDVVRNIRIDASTGTELSLGASEGHKQSEAKIVVMGDADFSDAAISATARMNVAVSLALPGLVDVHFAEKTQVLVGDTIAGDIAIVDGRHRHRTERIEKQRSCDRRQERAQRGDR
jgi:hypothetical protein